MRKGPEGTLGSPAWLDRDVSGFHFGVAVGMGGAEVPWQFAHALPISDLDVAFATVAPAGCVKVLELESPMVAQDVCLTFGTSKAGRIALLNFAFELRRRDGCMAMSGHEASNDLYVRVPAGSTSEIRLIRVEPKFTLNKLGGFGRGYAVSQLDEAESDVLADRGTGDKGETNRRALALDGKRHELMSHDFDGFEQVQLVLFVDGPGGYTPNKCFESMQLHTDGGSGPCLIWVIPYGFGISHGTVEDVQLQPGVSMLLIGGGHKPKTLEELPDLA